MTKLKILAIALAAAMTTTSQADTVSVSKTIAQWEGLDTLCTKNVNPEMREPACKLRAQLSAYLEGRGWCVGKENQSGPEMKWHKCTKDSLRGAQ
jgi:hypothetical protein